MKKRIFLWNISFVILIISTLSLISSIDMNDIQTKHHSTSYYYDQLVGLRSKDNTLFSRYLYDTLETVEHEPISIDSNNDFDKLATTENWRGNGTITNPYIIKGYNFTNIGDSIKINNSDMCFQIKKCFFNGKGKGIGILFNNVSNGYITNNTFFNNEVGIQLDYFSKKNIISENLISNNSHYGIEIGEDSELNIIKLNDFSENNNYNCQANDNGFCNKFAFNFWSDWIEFDVDADGIIDESYSITGSANNNDTYPLSNPNPPQKHLLTDPIIINPINKEKLKGKVLIQWIEAIDSFKYDIIYSLHFSKDQRIWKHLISDLRTNSYIFDTMMVEDGSSYCIRVQASCLENDITSTAFFGPFSVQNIFTPLFRFIFALFVIIIVVSLLFGVLLWRKRVSSPRKLLLKQVDKQKIRLGLCFGSFTDKGLIIQGKNENCPFSNHQLQSMLEYSAVLYQYGKEGEMYGPFPLTSLKEEEKTITVLQEGWNFVSYWIKVIDDSIEDLRVIKHMGEVPAALLLFYSKQFDSIIMLYKKDICDTLNLILRKYSKVSEITPDLLNQVEKQILSFILS
ncbi:MAG: right-handed parallel beta-helix repeat-containing protein [Promethearchaeota archaeon]